MDDLNTYSKLRQMFIDDCQFISKFYRKAVTAFDMYNGNQWNSFDKHLMKQGGKNPITINTIKPAIDAILGSELQSKRDIVYMPRVTGSSSTDDLLNSTAGWFRDQAGAEPEESDAFRNAIICGAGFLDIGVEYEGTQAKPVISSISPFEMVWDAAASKANMSDANHFFRVTWLTIEDFRAMFPYESDQSFGAPFVKQQELAKNTHKLRTIGYRYEFDNNIHTSDDDRTKNMYPLVEARWREREIEHYVMPDDTLLSVEDYEYLRQNGSIDDVEYCMKAAPAYHSVIRRAFLGKKLLGAIDHPMADKDCFGWLPITAYYDNVKGRYYGVVRNAEDVQRLSNRLVSQALFTLDRMSKTGLLVEEGAVEDMAELERNYSSSGTVVKVKNDALREGRIRDRKASEIPNSLLELSNKAEHDMQRAIGLSPEFMGLTQLNQNEKLENTRREATLNILAGPFYNLREYRKFAGRQILFLIQNAIPDGVIIRVSGVQATKYVPFIKKDINSAEYDVMVSDAPVSTNEKQECFEKMTEILPVIDNMIEKGYSAPTICLYAEYAPLPATLINELKLRIMDEVARREAVAMGQPPQSVQPNESPDLMSDMMKPDAPADELGETN